MYRAGVAQGRFREMDPAAVRTLVFGVSRMLQRDMLMGLSNPDHGVQVVALLLSACGLPFDEALEVSERGAVLAAEIQAAVGAP